MNRKFRPEKLLENTNVKERKQDKKINFWYIYGNFKAESWIKKDFQ